MEATFSFFGSVWSWHQYMLRHNSAHRMTVIVSANLYNGATYMSAFQRFREIEDGQLRGDKYEAIGSVRNYLSDNLKLRAWATKDNFLP